MKKIIAFFKPFRLEAVVARLPREGVVEWVVAEVRGYGRQKGQLELYEGGGKDLTFLPKARLEVYCEDAALDAVLAALVAAARTGRIGDGKILVLGVEWNQDV